MLSLFPHSPFGGTNETNGACMHLKLLELIPHQKKKGLLELINSVAVTRIEGIFNSVQNYINSISFIISHIVKKKKYRV